MTIVLYFKADHLQEEGRTGGPVRAQPRLPTGRVRPLAGSGRGESADVAAEVSTVGLL